jgi:hypothetical protein
MSIKTGDIVERTTSGGLRVIIEEAPYGTFTLNPEELAMLAHHNERCLRCSHLHLFHPVKGGFCVVGKCHCTLEEVWQWNLEKFLKLQPEDYKEYLEKYTKYVRGITRIESINI